MASKEEEIANVKWWFLEEKKNLELDKKKLTNSLADSKETLDALERWFRDYRKEQDESPMAVLRAEIQNKNIVIMELESQI